MDTETLKSGYPAILIDYDDWSYSPRVRQWANARSKHAMVVLLVTDPERNDFEYGDERWEKYAEPAMVIRNNPTATRPKLPSLTFKTAALTTVQVSTTMVPVGAYESDAMVRQMYSDAGVLYVRGGEAWQV